MSPRDNLARLKAERAEVEVQLQRVVDTLAGPIAADNGLRRGQLQPERSLLRAEAEALTRRINAAAELVAILYPSSAASGQAVGIPETAATKDSE